MTSGGEPSSGSGSPCSRRSSLERSMRAGRTMKRSAVTNAVIRTSRIDLEHPPGGNGGQAGHEAGEDPQREEERHRGVDIWKTRRRATWSSSMVPAVWPGDREEADRREADDQPVGTGEGPLDHAQRVEQRPLPLDAHEGDAEQRAEQHDRGHDAVGQRVERVRRDVEGEEVDRLPLLHEGGAEEGRGLERREHERHQEDEAEGQCPTGRGSGPRRAGRAASRRRGRGSRCPRSGRPSRRGGRSSGGAG